MANIEVGSYEQNTRPRWAGDYTGREHNLPGGIPLDGAQFARKGGQTVTVNGSLSGGETTVVVDALAADLPAGSYLAFSGGANATTTEPASEGDTSLTTTAVSGAVADNETVTISGSGKRYVPSGTVVGRTYAERDAGDGFGPAAAADDQVYLLIHDVDDAGAEAAYAAYRNGSLVYENFLPDFAGLAGAVQTLIRDKYDCQIGAD